MGTFTGVVDGYSNHSERCNVRSRTAKASRRLTSRTPARLLVYDTLLERLAQDLQNMASELRELIQEEHTMVGQRHLAWQRHVAPADQPHI